MSSFFGRDRSATVRVLFMVFAFAAAVVAAEESTPASVGIDKPLPSECALLDDPGKRALMDGLLLKLAIMCDRTEFLGEVRQKPNMEIEAPDTGTDVPVNDPAGDSGSSTTQSETSLAVSEITGTICSGFNDSYHGVVQGQGYTGFARSTDGGATFTDGLAVGSGSFGDPAMVWRKTDGHFYLATLGSSGLRIYQSADDCQTFQLLGKIHTGGSDDKELMAVDNNPDSPTLRQPLHGLHQLHRRQDLGDDARRRRVDLDDDPGDQRTIKRPGRVAGGGAQRRRLRRLGRVRGEHHHGVPESTDGGRELQRRDRARRSTRCRRGTRRRRATAVGRR